MNTHRYILEPYKGMNTRYRCPSCDRSEKTFSLYIDTETGEHLHPTVGRCNRESNCGYHYTPKQYFQDNNFSFDTPQPKAYKHRPVPPQPKPVSFIPVEAFKASLNPTAFETNHFVQFLKNLFGVEVASQLVGRYFIGTSKYQFSNKDFPNYKSERGANIFWQIDTKGKIRTGKIMLYSPTTGKRIKEPFNHINWVHKALKQPEFELRQCLFGEHLLIEKTRPVAIVESEKTAVIASVYLPQFIWVAVGSLTNLNAEKCSILKGRTVTLFPDLNGFDKWSNKAKELSHLATFTVSDLLERKTTEAEKKQGFDLADYLIKCDYKAFARPDPPPPTDPTPTDPTETRQPEPEPFYITPDPTPVETWQADISELEQYFSGITMPSHPVRLNGHITDISQFIDSHLQTVKANDGKARFRHYLTRLQELQKNLLQP